MMLPDSVRIEASTLCQLNCLHCPMRRDESVIIGKGYLKFLDFKSFVDRHAYVKSIELANCGEIFLNPEIDDIIKYAYEKNVTLTANSGSNFNTVADSTIEALVKYKFSSISVAIDGTSQEVYSIYRRNGNYDKVIENIQKINEYKRIYDTDIPKLYWAYILMEHTEDDIVNAKILANELGMELLFKLTWEKGYVPTPSKEKMLRDETGLRYLTREEYEKDNPSGIGYFNPCMELWNRPTINWDGRLLGCCGTARGEFGINVFEAGLEKALDSDNYKYAKLMVQGKASLPSSSANEMRCADCHIYKNMVDKNRFVTAPRDYEMIDFFVAQLSATTIYYGAGRNMSVFLGYCKRTGIPFELPIWDINGDTIYEVQGHKITTPDFAASGAGKTLVITVDSEAIRNEVAGQFKKLGYNIEMYT